MKYTGLFRNGALLTGLVLSSPIAAPAAPLGAEFTYQGQLKNSGSPASGSFNMVFTLWNDPTLSAPANQVGPTLTFDGVGGNPPLVAVANGLFTVQLDFGGPAYQGDQRWLELTVSGTTLSPRQPLTPAPYALALPAMRIEQNATSPNVIGGYSGNSVLSGVVGATIGGGGQQSFGGNSVTNDFGTVGGGDSNTASGDFATVGGGVQNTASGYFATVGGGHLNSAENYATVGGGDSNSAGFQHATVGGGQYNSADGFDATVGGGGFNTASGFWSTVGGGGSNYAVGYFATVGGGASNSASGFAATVGGGEGNNTATATYATIAGGGHSNPDDPSTGNRVFDDYGTIGGGGGNRAGSDDSDTATAPYATVGGGESNEARGLHSTVAGGRLNIADAHGVVGGGVFNFAAGGTIGGGLANSTEGGTVGGGSFNQAFGEECTVGGGGQNGAFGSLSTVGGGLQNVAGDDFSTVGGGQFNEASGASSSIGGGENNTASGFLSTVSGGKSNEAGGDWSFAAGRRAKVRTPALVGGGDVDGDQGTFVWADSTDADFTSSGANQFLIRAGGGVGINTDSPAGFALAVNGTAAKPGGGSWAVFSDARLKTNVAPLSGTLDRLLSLRGYEFEYTPEAVEANLGLPGRQIGLLAQEVQQVFPDWVGRSDAGYLHVTERATTALMVEALRELRAENDTENQALRRENAELRARLERLERALSGASR